MKVQVIGVPWYKREQYDEILRVMEDASLLPRTYDAWLQAAEKVFESQERIGIVAVKAYVDPATFPDWCRARGLTVNAAARIQYASTTAADAYRQGNE